MPRYVEEQFIKACAEIGLKVEPRADGLWRIEHVLADLRSDRLEAVRRSASPRPPTARSPSTRSHLEQDQHLDAVLIGPGHPLYAAVDERLNEQLRAARRRHRRLYVDRCCRRRLTAPLLRDHHPRPEHQGRAPDASRRAGRRPRGTDVRALAGKRFSVVPADCLLDLPAHPNPPEAIGPLDPGPPPTSSKAPTRASAGRRARRSAHFVQVCREYLGKVLHRPAIRAAQDRVMALRAREAGAPEVAHRTSARRERADGHCSRSQKERLAGLDGSPWPSTAPCATSPPPCCCPPAERRRQPSPICSTTSIPNDPRSANWPPKTWSSPTKRPAAGKPNGSGTSKSASTSAASDPADAQTGYRDPVHGIRRIEVKGAHAGNPSDSPPTNGTRRRSLATATGSTWSGTRWTSPTPSRSESRTPPSTSTTPKRRSWPHVTLTFPPRPSRPQRASKKD